MNTLASILAALILPATLLGCAAPKPTQSHHASLTIDASDYDRAIDAARQVLIDNRFEIDRVDARRGIITTAPKQTAGLATPWDQEQSSLDQEWADLVHHHERVVRVSFTRPSAGEPIEATVLASIIRIRRPNWRLETESIRHSTHAITIEANNTRAPATMREPIGEDAALSEKIASQIEAKLIAP